MECGNCIFYDGKGKGIGHCKFNPPQMLEEHSNREPFPEVADFDWCGKWKEENDDIPDRKEA